MSPASEWNAITHCCIGLPTTAIAGGPSLLCVSGASRMRAVLRVSSLAYGSSFPASAVPAVRRTAHFTAHASPILLDLHRHRLRLHPNPNPDLNHPRATRSFTRSVPSMSVEASMQEKLTSAFGDRVKIRNDSHLHAHHAAMVAARAAGHAGATGEGGRIETHFFVEVVSDKFAGMPTIRRHRAVNSLLQSEFDAGLHALSLRLKTPSEIDRELHTSAQ